MRHRGENRPDPSDELGPGAVEPRHRKLPPETEQANGLLAMDLLRIQSRIEYFGMDTSRQFFDVWRNDARLRLYVGPLQEPQGAIRIVLNRHAVSALEDEAGIFVDDIIIANQNLSCSVGFMPMDKKTGDAAEITKKTPPLIWEATDDRWYVYEKNPVHDIPSLPGRKDEAYETLARATIAGHVAQLLSGLSEIERVAHYPLPDLGR